MSGRQDAGPDGDALEILRLALDVTTTADLVLGVVLAQAGANSSRRQATTVALAHIAGCLARRVPAGERQELLAEFDRTAALQPSQRQAELTAVRALREVTDES